MWMAYAGTVQEWEWVQHSMEGGRHVGRRVCERGLDCVVDVERLQLRWVGERPSDGLLNSLEDA